MAESLSGIEIVKSMPPALQESLIEGAGIQREKLAQMLPLNTGRGVPADSNINHSANYLAGMLKSERFPFGHPTYGSGSKVDGEGNAFRGDRFVLDFIKKNLKDDFGLEVDRNQIVTGTEGAQALSTLMMRILTHDEGRTPIFAEMTYDRMLKDTKLESSNSDAFNPQTIQVTAEGLDLDQLRDALLANKAKGSAFYLVTPGGNPDGYTIPMKNLVQACDYAVKHKGVLLMDAAYLSLYFDDESKYDLAQLKPYVDSGHIVISRSATKEGGGRAAAYQVGDKKRMERLLLRKSDKSLSPNYGSQIEWAVLETLNFEAMKRADFDRLIERARRALEWSLISQNEQTSADGKALSNMLSMHNPMPMEEFRQNVVRPTLKQSFENVAFIFREAGIELSNPKVDHGYNVIVKLPEDATQAKCDEFYKLLGGYGVKATPSDNFSVKGKAPNGFRLPFGGFSPEQCTVIAKIVSQAYKEIFG